MGWEQKFAYDVWYVDHRSLALDLKILWLTIRQVVTRQGISAEGEATMGEFMGSSKVREMVETTANNANRANGNQNF